MTETFARQDVEALHKERLAHYDLQDPTGWDHVIEEANSIREQHPVTWSDTYGGFWNLTGYDLVFGAALDAETFSTEMGAAPIQFDLEVMRMLPLEVDDPKHRQIRMQLWPFFQPSAIRSVEGPVREIIRDLMSDCVKQGQVDMVAEFGWKIPPRVFSSLFFRESDPATVDWMLAHIANIMANPANAGDPEFYSWFSDTLEQRRQANDRDSLVGTIAHMGFEGDLLLTERERTDTFFLMVMAGMETTASMLSHSCEILAKDPAIREQLRGSDTETFHRVVQEFMRLRSGVPAAARTLTRDLQMDGCPMKKGDRVYLNWVAANHDPAAYPDPETIDFNRPNRAKHVAFGGGVHRCLGAHLAEQELRFAIEEICNRPTFELVPGTSVRYRGGMQWGPKELLISLT